MLKTTRKFRKGLGGILVVALVSLLAMPAFAAAQETSIGAAADQCDTPTGKQYKDQATCIEALTGGGGDDPGSGDPSSLDRNVGPLPFTGFDVIAMAAVALAVTGLGLALQRAVARDPS